MSVAPQPPAGARRPASSPRPRPAALSLTWDTSSQRSNTDTRAGTDAGTGAGTSTGGHDAPSAASTGASKATTTATTGAVAKPEHVGSLLYTLNRSRAEAKAAAVHAALRPALGDEAPLFPNSARRSASGGPLTPGAESARSIFRPRSLRSAKSASFSSKRLRRHDAKYNGAADDGSGTSVTSNSSGDIDSEWGVAAGVTVTRVTTPRTARESRRPSGVSHQHLTATAANDQSSGAARLEAAKDESDVSPVSLMSPSSAATWGRGMGEAWPSHAPGFGPSDSRRLRRMASNRSNATTGTGSDWTQRSTNKADATLLSALALAAKGNDGGAEDHVGKALHEVIDGLRERRAEHKRLMRVPTGDSDSVSDNAQAGAGVAPPVASARRHSSVHFSDDLATASSPAAEAAEAAAAVRPTTAAEVDEAAQAAACTDIERLVTAADRHGGTRAVRIACGFRRSRDEKLAAATAAATIERRTRAAAEAAARLAAEPLPGPHVEPPADMHPPGTRTVAFGSTLSVPRRKGAPPTRSRLKPRGASPARGVAATEVKPVQDEPRHGHIDPDSVTPLFAATELNAPDVVRALLSASADAARGREPFLRYGPLHEAAACDYADVVEALMDASSELAAMRGEDGRTPLHVAAANDALHAASVLVERSPAELRTKDHKGLTPLHVACVHGFVDMTRLLLSASLDEARAIDDAGQTPLQHIIREDRVECIKLLLAAGAVWEGPSVQDELGRIPSDIARENGEPAVVAVLLRHAHVQPYTPGEVGIVPLDIEVPDHRTEPAAVKGAHEGERSFADDDDAGSDNDHNPLSGTGPSPWVRSRQRVAQREAAFALEELQRRYGAASGRTSSVTVGDGRTSGFASGSDASAVGSGARMASRRGSDAVASMVSDASGAAMSTVTAPEHRPGRAGRLGGARRGNAVASRVGGSRPATASGARMRVRLGGGRSTEQAPATAAGPAAVAAPVSAEDQGLTTMVSVGVAVHSRPRSALKRPGSSRADGSVKWSDRDADFSRETISITRRPTSGGGSTTATRGPRSRTSGTATASVVVPGAHAGAAGAYVDVAVEEAAGAEGFPETPELKRPFVGNRLLSFEHYPVKRVRPVTAVPSRPPSTLRSGAPSSDYNNSRSPRARSQARARPGAASRWRRSTPSRQDAPQRQRLRSRPGSISRGGSGEDAASLGASSDESSTLVPADSAPAPRGTDVLAAEPLWFPEARWDIDTINKAMPHTTLTSFQRRLPADAAPHVVEEGQQHRIRATWARSFVL